MWALFNHFGFFMKKDHPKVFSHCLQGYVFKFKLAVLIKALLHMEQANDPKGHERQSPPGHLSNVGTLAINNHKFFNPISDRQSQLYL